MPINAVHDDTHPDPAKRNTVQHSCARCGYERYLRIDPAHGDMVVNAAVRSLATTPCPHCAEYHVTAATGEPLMVSESFRLDIAPWEAQEPLPGDHPLRTAHPEWGGIWQHPDSLLGMEMSLGVKDVHGRELTSVVIEHTHGYHLNMQEVEHRRLVRALQRHPHLAAHVPLDDTRHERAHAAAERRRQRGM